MFYVLEKHNTQDGQTALFIACKEGFKEVVEVLLQSDCNFGLQTNVRRYKNQSS